jgi:hypothetical protein
MHRGNSTNDFQTVRRTDSMTREFTRGFVIGASNFSTYFSLFLNNSKARDKFLAMFQYYFDFTCTCAQYSSIEQIRRRYRDRTSNK